MTVIFQYTIFIDNNKFTRNRLFYDEFDLYFGLFSTKHGSVSGTCMCTISMSLRQLRSKKFLCSKIGKASEPWPQWSVTWLVHRCLVHWQVHSRIHPSFILYADLLDVVDLYKREIYLEYFYIYGYEYFVFQFFLMKEVFKNFVEWDFLFFLMLIFFNCAYYTLG